MAESYFQELKRYVGFTDHDARLLRELWPRIEPHAEAIVTRFYDRLLQHEGAAQVIQDAQQVVRLKATLQQWLKKLLTGPYDEDYFELRSRIGRKHVVVGLQQFYMFAAMDGIRNHLEEILLETYRKQPEQLQGCLAALSKVLDMELAIMLETYHQDLLAKLKAEEQRRHQEKLAAVQTMVASLAHEIRNPLNSASLHLTLLERRLSRGGRIEATEKPIAALREEISRLEKLLSDFISFTRPPRLNCSIWASLNPLLEQIAQEYADRAGSQKIEIRLRLDEDLLPVSFDWDRMHQVLSNLMINALEALPSGGTISLQTEKRSDTVVVRVSDTGPGLPKNVDVFEPFVTTKSQGTGLGLSIVRSIVEMHGGSICVEPSEKGAFFRIELPAPTLRGRRF